MDVRTIAAAAVERLVRTSTLPFAEAMRDALDEAAARDPRLRAALSPEAVDRIIAAAHEKTCGTIAREVVEGFERDVVPHLRQTLSRTPVLPARASKARRKGTRRRRAASGD